MASSSPANSKHPIIIVTGANTGVGFGVCHRLLLQLSSKRPSDALPQLEGANTSKLFAFDPVDGLTLILACRNADKAEAARQRLWAIFDAHVQKQKGTKDYDGHAEVFRENLKIDFVKCDLARAENVFHFCDEIKTSYPYVSYMVFNAGLMAYAGIDWVMLAQQLLTEPKEVFAAAKFKIQHTGMTTDEGYGYIWQCNVFGHFIIAKELQKWLRGSPSSRARVIWMSSVEAEPEHLDMDDWQLTKTTRSYEGSKYEVDLLVMTLNAQAAENAQDWSSISAQPRHIIVHPAIVASDIFVAHMVFSAFFDFLMHAVLYIVRGLGSNRHPIAPVSGAISATHAILAPLSCLPPPSEPVKIGSRSTYFGTPYVRKDPVYGWETHKADGEELLRRMNVVYAKARAKRLVGIVEGHAA